LPASLGPGNGYPELRHPRSRQLDQAAWKARRRGGDQRVLDCRSATADKLIKVGFRSLGRLSKAHRQSGIKGSTFLNPKVPSTSNNQAIFGLPPIHRSEVRDPLSNLAKSKFVLWSPELRRPVALDRMILIPCHPPYCTRMTDPSQTACVCDKPRRARNSRNGMARFDHGGLRAGLWALGVYCDQCALGLLLRISID